jgi:hypothetical protein
LITNKQLVKLEKEEFEQKSLAELKIKDLAAKLKYHQISDIEITEKLNKAQTVVYQIKGKLIENQELITKHENSCGRFILATNILDTSKLAPTEILKIYKEQQSYRARYLIFKTYNF